MGIKITRGKAFPIGVDLAGDVLRMAQLKQGEESMELLSAGSEALPPSVHHGERAGMDAIASSIRSIMRRASFRGRRAVLCIPSGDSFIHHVKTPKLPADSISQAVNAELAGKLPYPVEEAVIRHVVVGDVLAEGDTRQEVIAISARRKVVEDYLDMAARARLDVVGINIVPCAILECYARLFRRTDDLGRTILFLDVGPDATQVIVSHGCKLAFARCLSTGSMKFDDALAQGLSVPVEQARNLRRGAEPAGSAREVVTAQLDSFLDSPVRALADEVTQCLRYCETAFRTQGAERVIFVGQEAYDKRLCQMIAQRLNMRAQIGDPLMRIRRVAGAGLEQGLDRREPQPDWSVSIGLSIGAQAA
ncbi:MAG: pilus assembly protein PilM [Planctomycetes bacterium]|jgi:type IV pilus assembly protein PilM|nr:pilus assembly protein PilM [Planctomycetota bacterium]